MPVTRFGSAVLTAVILSGAAITNNAATVAKLDALEAGSSSTVLEGTLRNVHHPLLWQGRVGAEDAPTGGEPPECAMVPCDHFRLRLDLPPGAFANPHRPGGVQVALRWFGNPGGHTLPPGVPGCCGEFDTLHLWVYRNGSLIAASPGIIAVSQSAFIPEPDNGWYDIWIAYDPTFNVAPFVDYEALAEVEYLPNVNPVTRLLPDLTFLGTERITFATPSFPIFEPDPPAGSSCFNSEVVEDGAQTCLRFDQIIANIGKGATEIAYDVPSGSAPDEGVEFPVSQRIYNSDGTFADQPGGSVNYHGVHGHYHYSSFADAKLWASNAGGQKLGNAPVAASHKVSFCMADIRIDSWAEKGDGPRKYYAPDCLFPYASDGVADQYRQGVNHGWSDVYDWYIPDQYIEVTGVPDGFYRLEFCADPFNELEEADETNNCVVNHIHLSGMGGLNKSVQVLGVLKK